MKPEKDMTLILEHVARTVYHQMVGDNPDARPWHEVDALQKHQLKNSLLPIVTATIEVLETDLIADQMIEELLGEQYLTTGPGAPISRAEAAYFRDHTYEQQGFWHPYVAGVDVMRDGRYESNPRQTDVSTATGWVLHLEVLDPGRFPLIFHALETLPIRVTSGRLTGEYLDEGDAFREWGTSREPGESAHLAIYFTANTPEQARATGNYFAGVALTAAGEFVEDFREHFAISTAGDFAEQLR